MENKQTSLNFLDLNPKELNWSNWTSRFKVGITFEWKFELKENHFKLCEEKNNNMF